MRVGDLVKIIEAPNEIGIIVTLSPIRHAWADVWWFSDGEYECFQLEDLEVINESR